MTIVKLSMRELFASGDTPLLLYMETKGNIGYMDISTAVYRKSTFGSVTTQEDASKAISFVKTESNQGATLVH